MATRSPLARGVDSVPRLLDTTPVVDAGLGETGVERLLCAVALTDGAERPGIATVRRYREEGPRGGALQRAKHLHLVANLLLPIEVEGHLTLADDGRSLDHVRGEGDTVPAHAIHPGPSCILAARRQGYRLPRLLGLVHDAHVALREPDVDALGLQRGLHGDAELAARSEPFLEARRPGPELEIERAISEPEEQHDGSRFGQHARIGPRHRAEQVDHPLGVRAVGDPDVEVDA